jgi:hypothetical protein
MPTEYSLAEIQRWLQTVITHPGGVSAGVASTEAMQVIPVAVDQIEQVILPSRELNSFSRLQIYGHAYFGRLIECLKAQFPAVHHAVGDKAFNGLAFGYLNQVPSRSYTLGHLGDSFDLYLQQTRPARAEHEGADQPDFADFVIDLARLERTYNDVFDGPGPERSSTLQASDLSGLTAGEFANCRIQFHSCVRLLELRFPVHEYASAVRRGAEISPPDARPVLLGITRRDYIVRRFELTRLQFQLLNSLRNQSTIGQALSACCSDPELDALPLRANLQQWFYEWAAAPLFASLDRPAQPVCPRRMSGSE